jgi:hypothetical protein
MKQTTKTGKAWRTVKRKIRKAGMALAFAGALLVSGPMKANAKPKVKSKPTIELETGIGYMHGAKDVRAMILAKGEIPLPLKMKLNTTVGLSGSLNNKDVGLEEVEAKLTAPIAGPVTASAGFLRSKHGGVENLISGSVFTGLPFGAAGVVGGYLFDFKTVPLFGVLVWNPHPRITVNGLGGAVIRGDAGILGGGANLRLSENTTLKIDSWNIVNEQGAVVANLKLNLGYRF